MADFRIWAFRNPSTDWVVVFTVCGGCCVRDSDGVWFAWRGRSMPPLTAEELFSNWVPLDDEDAEAYADDAGRFIAESGNVC